MTRRRQLIQTASACLAAVALLALPSGAQADSRLESMFQDDNMLIFNTPEGTAKTMDTMQLLGVDRIRVSVFWKTVAPDGAGTVKPAFDAADPAAYPPGSWDRYDQIVRLARQRNIAVNFNITSPAPNWATGTAPREDIDETFDPSAREFGLFVRALGVRYSGAYMAGGALIPRVRYWSIWNEPNQPGWLTPQWAKDPRSSKAMVETAPVIYRRLVDAAWTALHATQHGDDTILIGETAPKGQKDAKGTTRAIPALRFIRQLYCLDDNLQMYKGTSAELRGCPVGAKALQDFPAQHPALFQATGYAHHPYELLFSPHTRPGFKDYATIANLDDLSKLLRRIYQRYRQLIPDGQKNVPLYLTEFGYQTNPPDPGAVSLNKQAAWNNEAEYRAWADKSVRTLNQFLLVDDKPVPGPTPLAAYGSSFQTGLLNLDGTKKPSYGAYAMAIYLPSRKVGASRRLKLWGTPRVAPDNTRQTVTVQVRQRRGAPFQKVGSLKTDGRRGYVNASVKVRRSGTVRLAWKDAAGRTWVSREVAFSLTKKQRAKKN
jgi:hypothetical protein